MISIDETAKKEPMKLINLTTRTIRIYDLDGLELLYELPTTPPAPSVIANIETVMTINNVSVVRHTFTLLDDLPPSKSGVIYVVGWPVIQAMIDQGITRDDVVAPDTGRGSAVRDQNGNILGVKQFRVF
jgi:hypothetical protein